MMDHKEKLLHKRMAQARTAMRKLSAKMKEDNTGKWVMNVMLADGMANIIQEWIDELEKEER